MVAHALTIREVEGGFPHSEIPGSKLVRSSPRLIAAYHVLHRLSAPRHPPNALIALDRSHDRCPHLSTRTSVRKDHACRHARTNAPLRGCELVSGRCRYPASPNMASLHDVKHPRKQPQQGAKARVKLFALHLRQRQTIQNSWWSRTGSNRRPHACKARALPTELRPQREYATRWQAAPDHGGPGTTRTSDLTLIRGAL
jgi:hypothetical protein